MTDIAKVAEGLSEAQRSQLSCEQGFAIDGWCSQRGGEAAIDMEARGLVVSEISGGEQYTRIDYSLTPLGQAVRKHLMEQEG